MELHGEEEAAVDPTADKKSSPKANAAGKSKRQEK
jgi:hypothetical protein